jgi:hypothetical protein
VIIVVAWCSAVEALAQAFSTFTTGIAPMPADRSTTLDPGVLEGGQHRLAAQRLESRLHVLAEAGHPHAGHDRS